MTDRLAEAAARADADAAWRAEPCTCGRRPYTRERHRFLTGNYACRNRALGVHRHFRRECEGCGEVLWRPDVDEKCSAVGIGEG